MVFDPAGTQEKPKYVWDLAFDAQGPAVHRDGRSGGDLSRERRRRANSPSKAELFFKSDEEHIRSLAFDKAGNLIAGSDGTGLVYRIDPAGKAFVLYDAPKKEITSVIVAPDGTHLRRRRR